VLFEKKERWDRLNRHSLALTNCSLLVMVPTNEDNCMISFSDEKSDAVLKRFYKPHDNSIITQLPKEFRHFLAGGIAGMTAKSIVAPLDRIKILYQVSSLKFHILDVPRLALQIIREEGIGALWKGNTATMIRVFPYSGIQFMVFDRCKTWFLKEKEIIAEYELPPRAKNDLPKRRDLGLSPIESLVSGSVAGICSVLLTYPLDMARAQLAVMKKKKHQQNLGLVGLFSKNYTQHGIVGLYRGITPTILGILPYAGIAFSLNEQSKQYIQNMTGREVTTIEKIQCGAISGLLAQTFTYPLEVTRRRIQTLGIAIDGRDTAVGILGHANQSKNGGKTSMVSVMNQVYREQGTMGFFKGVSLNWIKGPVAFSISFTTFDYIKDLIATDSEKLTKISTTTN